MPRQLTPARILGTLSKSTADNPYASESSSHQPYNIFIMEQKTSDDNSSEQPEDARISPPSKKAKRQPGENSLSSDATSNDAATTAGNLDEANVISN